MQNSDILSPVHPGEILREDYLVELGWTGSELARHLSVSPSTINRLLGGRLSISVEMAIRLSVLFNTSIVLWLNLQQAYDLAKAQKLKSQIRKEVKSLKRA